MSECCLCEICNKKFINADGTVDNERLAVIMERTFLEYRAVGFSEEYSFNKVKKIKDCRCFCHQMEDTDEKRI